MAIIAAVDNSERASKIAREGKALAEAFDDDLHVIHVLSQSRAIDLERTSIQDTGQPVERSKIKAVATEIATEAAEDIEGNFETAGIMGNPMDEITRYSTDNDGQYIVIGGRKRSPLGKAVFGSITQSVLLNSDCPVVTVTQNQKDS